jgi:hypothetical protein
MALGGLLQLQPAAAAYTLVSEQCGGELAPGEPGGGGAVAGARAAPPRARGDAGPAPAPGAAGAAAGSAGALSRLHRCGWGGGGVPWGGVRACRWAAPQTSCRPPQPRRPAATAALRRRPVPRSALWGCGTACVALAAALFAVSVLAVKVGAGRLGEGVWSLGVC